MQKSIKKHIGIAHNLTIQKYSQFTLWLHFLPVSLFASCPLFFLSF